MKAAFIVPENEIMSYMKKEIKKLDSMTEYKARKRLWAAPHLGLLTVAAMLPESWKLTYIDLNYTFINNDSFDWIFISPTTSQANRAYELADSFRKTGTRIVMGGCHVSILPDEALKHADVIFIGEAEDTIKQFLEDIGMLNFFAWMEQIDQATPVTPGAVTANATYVLDYK